jgi:cytochrome c
VVILAVVVANAAIVAQEADPAAEAKAEAIAKGKALFHDPGFGTKDRACAKCHEDSKRPKLHLKERVQDYPKWDRREKRVITLGQKIDQMIQRMLKGESLPLGSEKLVAIEAYLMSISRDAK